MCTSNLALGASINEKEFTLSIAPSGYLYLSEVFLYAVSCIVAFKLGSRYVLFRKRPLFECY